MSNEDRPEPCPKCKGYHREDGIETCPIEEDEERAMLETYEGLNRWLDWGIARDIRRNRWGGS